MIENVLKRYVEAGVKDLAANPAWLRDICIGTVRMNETQADATLEFWANTDNKGKGAPSVHHGYPRTNVQFPAIFLILSSDSESDVFLGDGMGTVLGGGTIGGPQEGDEVSGAIYTDVYTFLIMAQNPDICITNYNILKSILYIADKSLQEEGVLASTISGGDMAPDKKWMPDGFFFRQLTYTVKEEFCIGVKDDTARAWAVSGIHIDRNGAPGEDVGNVQTLVTTFTPGEDNGQ